MRTHTKPSAANVEEDALLNRKLRTTVFIDEDVLIKLKAIAKEEGRPLVNVIREALSRYALSAKSQRG